jgi:hypothetical protein
LVVTAELFAATEGAGPLLQRDYWAVLSDTALKPSELMACVKSNFCSLPPESLVHFDAPDGVGRDAAIDIRIKPSQQCGVRVIHDDAQSLTFGTLTGHPEAGRITFGAYRNPAGQLIFHIRSRARSTSPLMRIGFVAIGEAMQTNTWIEFVRNTALLAGAGIVGVIHVDTTEVDETDDDRAPLRMPTFIASGD